MTTATRRADNDPASAFDHNDPSIPGSDVRALYARFTTECPVAHIDRYGGFDLLTKYDLVRETASNAEQFISGDGVFIPTNDLPRVLALEFDGEEHKFWRSLLSDLLSPTVVRQLDPKITEVANEQIDTFASHGHADLATAYADTVTAVVIGHMVGFNTEEALVNGRLATDAFTKVGDPQHGEYMQRFLQYNVDGVRRHAEEGRTGVLDRLGRRAGIEVNDELKATVSMAFLLGGHHSTASGMAGLIVHALQNQGLRDSLAADPQLLARAVEESLRLSTPLQLFGRTVTEHCVLSDVEMQPGTRIMLNYAAANRDPDQFDDPDTFSLDRDRSRHLAFGFGNHFCVGAHLARAEMRIALTELLRRLPDIRLAGEVTTTGLLAGGLMSVTSLPVEFTPERSGA